MADELISRQAILEKFQYRTACDNYAIQIIRDCVEIGRKYIEDAPAVDAVEVVRCCACKWWNTAEVGMTGDMCRCERFSLVGYSENYTDPMDFCSYGERREENAADI